MQLPPDNCPLVPLPFRDDNARLLAELSHEIRTPLTAMLGYVELLRESNVVAAEPASAREALSVIESSSRHLLDLVNSILDWSRLDVLGHVTRVPTDPVQIAEEVVRLLALRIGQRDLRMEVICDPTTPRSILSDPTRLRQILLNLVGNALKFTAAGEVRVELRGTTDAAGHEQLTIDVCDTGPGMTASEVARLFQPFSQSNDQIQSRYGGTGLGLAISLRLCQLLDGQLSVESKPGIGSTFRVELPVEFPLAQATEPTLPDNLDNTRPALHLADFQILLADDHAETRRLIALVLRAAGAEVVQAADGRDAYNVVQTSAREFDIILLDLDMPIVDGYAACRELRGSGYVAPIVALSAATDGETRTACHLAGFDDFAAKPIDRFALLQLLQRYRTTLAL